MTGTMTDLLDIGGVAEIAEEFGVGRTVVSMWDARRAGNGFPAPLKVLAMGPIYSMPAVRDWYSGKAAPRRAS